MKAQKASQLAWVKLDEIVKIKEVIFNLKNKLKVPVKELQIGSHMSLLFFQIGQDPYYIKVSL